MRWWLGAGLAGLAMAGCREVTYKFPTEQNHLATPETAPSADDYKPAVAWEKKFELSSKKGAGVLVSPLLAWNTSLLFVNGANGDTYDKTVAALGLNENRASATTPANQWLVTSQKRGMDVHQGLFFVWPIVPSLTFQQDAAHYLDADVVKIGSAGNGATQTVTHWLQTRAATATKAQLSRDYMFVDYGVMSVNPKPEGVSWQNEDGTPYKGSFRTVDQQSAVTSTFASLGLPFAGHDPVNLHNIASELDAEPVKGDYQQVISSPIPDAKGAWYRLVDNQTGQILLCGNL